MSCPKLERRFICVDCKPVEQLFCKALLRVMAPESPKVKLMCLSDAKEYTHCYSYGSKPGPLRL